MMGIYLNPGNEKFSEAIHSQIYVDKTALIQYTNSVLHTKQKCICFSRPRRFGKSMAADMLAAYYSRGCDSRKLFENLTLSQDPSFEKYLNRYDVIALNMQEFLSRAGSVDKMLERLKLLIVRELKKAYPGIEFFDDTDPAGCMQEAYEESKKPFVVIIDEWDCIMREFKKEEEQQRKYLDFLRDLLKDKGYIYLAYLTGILPIKKYGTHSALNMFDEFSMTDPGPLAQFVGFTSDEVKALCLEYNMDFSEMKEWYDGYSFPAGLSVYSPRSVVSSIRFQNYGNYWNQTETYEALKVYIDLNFDGLKDDIIRMMDGEHINIHVESFHNDMMNFASADDVLTLLIHLGYLGYDSRSRKVFIPNSEILNEFVNAVRNSDWGEVTRALEMSQETLEAIWNQREEVVAKAICEAHLETSHLQYNDENALGYTVSLALFSARNFYTVVREMPAGNGFADIAFIPKKDHLDKPAILVELKWNRTAEGAIAQIRNKEYTKALENFKDNLLLVGINYDKETREHTCKIEKI